jgi:hypothetical protein
MSVPSRKQLPFDDVNQIPRAIEYLQYRYCLAHNEELANELASFLFYELAAPYRQTAFDALRVIVKWAAYSHWRHNNPALGELLKLREVYGQDEKQRVLDLASDLVQALDTIDAQLGLVSNVRNELAALPKLEASEEPTTTALYDLELDKFWGFTTLQRDHEEPIKRSTPLDVFFETSEVGDVQVDEEPVTSEEPTPAETTPSNSNGTFSKVYKLPQRQGASRNPVLDLLMGEDS